MAIEAPKYRVEREENVAHESWRIVWLGAGQVWPGYRKAKHATEAARRCVFRNDYPGAR